MTAMASVPQWLLYGANGYTGELAAREAKRRGLAPILAGRDAGAVKRLAGELDLPWRSFPLDDPAALRESLAGVAAVLHCAGPFVRTSAPMVEACLAAKVHYLDITGEIAVFEAVLSRGRADAARQAGIALLPGVGFDVVPSDCLAARLAAALPGAVALDLAFAAEGGGWSRGTLKTVIESLPATGAVRRNGKIVPVAIAADVRRIDFSDRPRWAMTIPWGDVATAYRTTGIPDIRVYTAAPPSQIRRLRRLKPLLPLAGWKPVKRWLARQVDRRVTGPDAEARATGRMHLWGEVRDAEGNAVSATLDTPEGYALTAVSSVESVQRVLAGQVQPGAWTPAQAFGSGYIEELPGVTAGELRRTGA
jgi:short subunit dehydrogenase-like uncharacterized protein